jgi:alkylated DNA repair dioxygenase AlkB
LKNSYAGKKMNIFASEFSRHKFVFLRSLLVTDQATQLYNYALNLVDRIQWVSDDQVPGTPSLYGERRMEELLVSLLPCIEDASGLSLYPTCSYLRVYKNGDVLARHKDRPACEISVSLNLGYQDDAQWPLCIEGPAGVSAHRMQPGDALLYRGNECDHWRDAFTGKRAAQVFLHYVDQRGPHAEWKFDKRDDARVLERFLHVQ